MGVTGRYFDPDEIHRKVILTEVEHDALCRIVRDHVESLEGMESDIAEFYKKLLADVEDCYDELAPSDDELRAV